MTSSHPLTITRDDRGQLRRIYRSTRARSHPPLKEVYIVSMRPGTSRGGHIHRRKHEVVVALRGRVRFATMREVLDHGGVRLLLPLDTVIHIPPGTFHEFTNVGTTDAELLVLSSTRSEGAERSRHSHDGKP